MLKNKQSFVFEKSTSQENLLFDHSVLEKINEYPPNFIDDFIKKNLKNMDIKQLKLLFEQLLIIHQKQRTDYQLVIMLNYLKNSKLFQNTFQFLSDYEYINIIQNMYIEQINKFQIINDQIRISQIINGDCICFQYVNEDNNLFLCRDDQFKSINLQDHDLTQEYLNDLNNNKINQNIIDQILQRAYILSNNDKQWIKESVNYEVISEKLIFIIRILQLNPKWQLKKIILENESLVNLKVFQNINKREVIFSYSKLKLALIDQYYYFGELSTKISQILNQKKQVLRQNINFKNLKQDEFQKFVENSMIKQVSEQQQIIKVDQKFLFIYFVSEGEVQMLKDKKVIFTFGQNSVFGDETLSDNNISQYDFISSKCGILIQIDILKLISQLAITSLTRYKIYDIFQKNFNVRQLQFETLNKPKLLKKESFENDHPQKLKVRVSTMVNLEELPQQKFKEDESFFKILKKNQFKTDNEIDSLENQNSLKKSSLKSSIKMNIQQQKINKNVQIQKKKTIEEIDELMSDLVSQQSLQESEINYKNNQTKFIQIKKLNYQQEAQKIFDLDNKINQINQQEQNNVEQKQNSDNQYYVQQKDKKQIFYMPNVVKNIKISNAQDQVQVTQKRKQNKKNNYSLDQQYMNFQDNNKLDNSQITQNTRKIDISFKDNDKKPSGISQFLNPLRADLKIQKNINFVNSKYSKKQNHISINEDILDSTSIEIIQKHKLIEQRRQSDDINQIRQKLNQIVQNKNTQQNQGSKDQSIIEEIQRQQQNYSKNYTNKSKNENEKSIFQNQLQPKIYIK